jgi:hypothetical protein
MSGGLHKEQMSRIYCMDDDVNDGDDNSLM